MALHFKKAESYLSRIGLRCVSVEDCPLERTVPLSLAETYEATFGEVQGVRYLFLLPYGQKPAPDVLLRHVESLARYYREPPVVLLREMDAEYYERIRSTRIGLVVPGRIAHIPGLVELKADNAFSAQEPVLGKYLSPWAQVVLLFQILNNRGRLDLPYARLTEALRLNRVYLTRAAKELERRHLARIDYRGTNGILVFEHGGKDLWRWAQDVLSSPVRKTIRTVRPPRGALLSGIAALARRSQLVPDKYATYAVVSSDVNALAKEDVREYEGDYVEGWKYDPRLLAGADGLVDPLSLYLTLRENVDPRVEEAREAMLEKVLWS